MKDWGDVRLCAACGAEAVWEVEEARWLHVVSGADHVAVVPHLDVPTGLLVDVDAVSSLLQAERGHTGRVVAEVLEQTTRDLTPRLCPGRCGSRWRSAVRRAVEEVHEAEQRDRPVDSELLQLRSLPRAGEPVWCSDDAALVVSAVRRLPDLVALVGSRGDGRLDAGRSDSDGRSSSGVAPPSPSPAHDLQDAAVRWAAAEAARLAELVTGGRGADVDDEPLPMTSTWLTQSVAYLLAHADLWLGDVEHGEQSGRAALRWESDLERATGQDLLVHRLPVRCPSCSTRALVRHDGLDQVSCTRCGWARPHSDYLAWVVEAAATQKALNRERRRAARQATA